MVLIQSCDKEKIHSDKVLIKDKIAYSKIDGEKLNGIVYNKFDEIGEYINGKKVGLHKEYHKNGKLKIVGNYGNNKKRGEWKRFYKNGKLKIIGNYNNNNKKGEWKWYYEDGKLMYQANYINDTIIGKHILWDKVGDDCKHSYFDSKVIFSWEDEDLYSFKYQNLTISSESKTMILHKCEKCNKYSGSQYLFNSNHRAYLEEYGDLYIPDVKIMNVKIIYIDSIFSIEESRLIPIYDTLIFSKSSSSENIIKINKSFASTSIIHCMNKNLKEVYPPIINSGFRDKSLLNPSRKIYAIDKVIYNNESIYKICFSPVNSLDRPPVESRAKNWSRYDSNTFINIYADYIFEAPPEKIKVLYREHKDGTKQIIDY